MRYSFSRSSLLNTSQRHVGIEQVLLQGNASGLEFLYQRKVVPVVYGACPLDVELGERSQPALKLICQTWCRSWPGCRGLAGAKRWPCKWFMVNIASRAGALKLWSDTLDPPFGAVCLGVSLPLHCLLNLARPELCLQPDFAGVLQTC